MQETSSAPTTAPSGPSSPLSRKNCVPIVEVGRKTMIPFCAVRRRTRANAHSCTFRLHNLACTLSGLTKARGSQSGTPYATFPRNAAKLPALCGTLCRARGLRGRIVRVRGGLCRFSSYAGTRATTGRAAASAGQVTLATLQAPKLCLLWHVHVTLQAGVGRHLIRRAARAAAASSWHARHATLTSAQTRVVHLRDCSSTAPILGVL